MKTVRMQQNKIKGMTGKLAENVTRNWLIGLRESNPAILAMFKDRDIKPYRDFLPWSGEFAGKYITGAYFTYRLNLDKALYEYILKFIEELMECQAEDGYLGCFDKEHQLTGTAPTGKALEWGTWDIWNHYHIMYGLLCWYQETGNEKYLETVEKIAALFNHKFYNTETGNRRIGGSEMDGAVIHTYAILFNITGKQCYLDFALEVEKDNSSESGGNYIHYALNGQEYYQCPKPRWESMHIIMGYVELYKATGKEYYLHAAEQIFWSIQKTDVHNTGAFSTHEKAIGNSFSEGPIETCCVIAYDALALELFKVTGNLRLIDFLEIAHYNACMGFWSPTGRWSTYDTPMNGARWASMHGNDFQSRPGSPELNCCSVNAARGISMISEWAVTKDEETLYINSYEDSECMTEEGYCIEISGDYPAQNAIRISIKNYTGRLALRIPEWSVHTSVNANGRACKVEAGKYCFLQCDEELTVDIVFDFSTRYMEGDLDLKGYVSVFRGPILFGTDVSLVGGCNVHELPILDKKEIENTPSVWVKDRICIPLSNGITLGDFYHLGVTGCEYVSWVKVE